MRQTKCQTRGFCTWFAPPSLLLALPKSICGPCSGPYLSPPHSFHPFPFTSRLTVLPFSPAKLSFTKPWDSRRLKWCCFFFGRDFWTCLIWMIKGCFQIIYQIFQVISLLEVDAGHCQCHPLGRFTKLAHSWAVLTKWVSSAFCWFSRLVE